MKNQKAINLFKNGISGELSGSGFLAGRQKAIPRIIENSTPSCNKTYKTGPIKKNEIPEIRTDFLENPFKEAAPSVEYQGEYKDTDDQVISMSAKQENLESKPKNVLTFPPSHELQKPHQLDDEKRVEDEHNLTTEQFPSQPETSDSSPHGCEILNPDNIFVCEKAKEPDRSVELSKAETIDIFFPNASEYGKLLGAFNMLGQAHSLNGIHRICVKGVRMQPFTTTAAKKACLPPALEPKFVPNCDIIPDKLKCVFRQPPKWVGCDKICMPCCCPALNPPSCDPVLLTNTCKRIEYRLPAFSECKRDPILKMCSKDCCYVSPVCPLTTIDHGWSPLIKTTIRQAWTLGRRTNMDMYKMHPFSTSAAVNASNKEKKQCKKKGSLPCLKTDTNVAHVDVGNRKACDKFCTPCCAPARDPPTCFHPYVKTPCEKVKSPWPSYSECKKEALKSPKPCECLIPRPPLCERTSADTERGCGRSD